MKKKVLLIILVVVLIAGVFGIKSIVEKARDYKEIYENISVPNITDQEVSEILNENGITDEDVKSVLENEEAVSDMQDMGFTTDTINGLKEYDPVAIEEAKEILKNADKSDITKFMTKYGTEIIK